MSLWEVGFCYALEGWLIFCAHEGGCICFSNHQPSFPDQPPANITWPLPKCDLLF